ncbi:MAG TPA: M17 family peptidase N-terminal domain-containing protein, partial [Candidatus Hodarchaeales archaeon]|nr:M17 family peptidase N-terminal domain-containing protein [Candidatus Hodarchaeales archaeon]
MKVEVKSGIKTDAAVDVLVIPIFEDDAVSPQFPPIDSGLFNKKRGDTFWAIQAQDPKRVFYIGLGKRQEASAIGVKKTLGAASVILREKGCTTVALLFPESIPMDVGDFCENTVAGVILGSYRFEKYMTNPEKVKTTIGKLVLLVRNENVSILTNRAKRTEIVSEATNFTRDLINTPHNDMNASILADQAKSLLDFGIKVKVWGREEIAKENMNLILSVNNGSREVNPAKF